MLGTLVTDFSLAEADRQMATLLGELLLWALVTMAGVIGAAIGLVHLLVTRPLGHFVKVTRAVGEGDLSQRVGLTRQDEVGELAASFDHMVQRVAARTRELEALNAVAATASRSLDLEGMLHQALETVCQVTETEWGAVHPFQLPADVDEDAVATARGLGCSEDEIRAIRWGALLHDIGKIGVPDRILLKPGELNDEEWEIIKHHPEIGAEIVAPVKKLADVAPVIRAHQEKYDGTGYPDRLKGEEIPLGARILAVVDAYGAIIDERPYKAARSHEEAVAELQEDAGTQFDPQVVKAFLRVLERGLDITGGVENGEWEKLIREKVDKEKRKRGNTRLPCSCFLIAFFPCSLSPLFPFSLFRLPFSPFPLPLYRSWYPCDG